MLLGASKLVLLGWVLSWASLLSAQPLGPLQQGIATFYGGPQDNTSPDVASFGLLSGSCGYKTLQQNEWPYWRATAIGPGNYLYSSVNMKGCGACIQANCTAGCNADAQPLTVLVTDTCDDCTDSQLNVHSLAFEQYFQSDLTVGQVSVSWQQVDCNPPGNIVAKVVDSRAGDGGFIAIALESVGGDGIIKNMEIMGAGQTSFSPMTASYGIVWQGSNLGSPPLSLQITGSSGETLVANGVITAVADGEYPTSVQFQGFGGGSVPAAQMPSNNASPTPPPSSVPVVVAPVPPAPELPPPSPASFPPQPSPASFPPEPSPASPNPVPNPAPYPASPPPQAAVVPAVAAPSPQLPPPELLPPSFASPPPPALPAPSPAPSVASAKPIAESVPVPVPGPVTAPSRAAQSPSNSTAPAPSASGMTTPAPAPARSNSTAPAPAPRGNATAPSPAPANGGNSTAPAPAPGAAPNGLVQSASTAMAPGMTSLTLNSNLTGAAASAANAIANPAVNIAG